MLLEGIVRNPDSLGAIAFIAQYWVGGDSGVNLSKNRGYPPEWRFSKGGTYYRFPRIRIPAATTNHMEAVSRGPQRSRGNFDGPFSTPSAEMGNYRFGADRF